MILKKSILLTLCLLFPVLAFAATPILNFTDLTSGPDSGNSDGKGSGSIVTIWGNNLGTPTVTSGTPEAGYHVYFTDSGSDQLEGYVYYWENADPASGSSGPSDMYTMHRMQEIAFAIPETGGDDGAGTITVVTPDGTSNGITFTVRSGSIYFVAPAGSGGDDGNTGTYSDPWGTFDNLDAKVSAGDVIYFLDGWESSARCTVNGLSGTQSNPIFVSTYPGAYALCQDPDNGVANYSNNWEYWSISKFVIHCDGSGINTFKGQRVVGNEVTDITCADGQSGALNQRRDQADNNKYFGNYVHDWGCSTTSGLEHATYFTNRSGNPTTAPEVGWNYLKDNQARNGIHHYEQTEDDGWTTTYIVKYNVVINQVGSCIASGSATGMENFTNHTEDALIYGNLCVNTGLPSDIEASSPAISINGCAYKGHWQFFNNTIYHYNITADNDELGAGIRIGSAGTGQENFNGTATFQNNIVFDIDSVPYDDRTPGAVDTNAQCTASETPFACCTGSATGNCYVKNIWWTTGTMPVGYETSIFDADWTYHDSDPNFTNPTSTPDYNDFTLQLGSPAINNGYDTSSIVTQDIVGVSRPQNGTIDIGAYEYVGEAAPSATSTVSGIVGRPGVTLK